MVTIIKLVFGMLVVTVMGCQNSKTTSTGANENEILAVARKSDTLTIQGTGKISDPFMFGRKPLTHLLTSNQPVPTSEEIEDHADSSMNEAGNYIKITIGTIYELHYGEDHFRFYKRADSVEFLVTSEITTNQFSNKWGAKIGMTKDEIKGKLNQFKIDSIPTTLIIGDLEYSFVQFDFEKNRLKKIQYHDYLD